LTIKSSLRLTLVRHGETEWTEKNLLHGRLDSPLSMAGKQHAGMAASSLAGVTFDALYTSPLGRAMQTAAILGKSTGLTPIPLDGLREMDYGWSEGRPMYRVYPNGNRSSIFRPVMRLMILLSGERLALFSGRVRSALEELIARHPGGRLLVVTHWGVLSLLMALMFEGRPQRWKKYGPWDACGISDVELKDGIWRPIRLNETRHLKLHTI